MQDFVNGIRNSAQQFELQVPTCKKPGGKIVDGGARVGKWWAGRQGSFNSHWKAKKSGRPPAAEENRKPAQWYVFNNKKIAPLKCTICNYSFPDGLWIDSVRAYDPNTRVHLGSNFAHAVHDPICEACERVIRKYRKSNRTGDCLVHQGLYKTGAVDGEISVCEECLRRDAVNKRLFTGLNAALSELQIRIPGLFITPACPSERRCECTYQTGCKELAEPQAIIPAPARPRSARQRKFARDQIVRLLQAEPSHRFEGTELDLARCLKVERGTLKTALDDLSREGQIARVAKRGRGGGTIIKLRA